MKITILSANRPDNDEWIPPTYHEMLEYFCDELHILGSPSFWDAVVHVKVRLNKFEKERIKRLDKCKAEIMSRKSSQEPFN